MEGPRDPELGVLLVRDLVGNAKGVLLNFSSHPNCLESAYCYSADFPGEARRLVSDALGHVPVLYLTGAAGDTAPSILDPFDPSHPWRGEEGLIRSGRYLAGTALRAIASATVPMVDPSLALAQVVLPIPMRSWPAPNDPAFPRAEEQLFIDYYQTCRDRWPALLASEGTISVRLNAIRIGDVVLCTNPGELFVECGLEIKRRSPTKLTMIAQLSDGYVGYLPTRKAFARGGYEIWPTMDGRCEVGTSERIVEETTNLLARLGF
jgi:neutral ceramidase